MPFPLASYYIILLIICVFLLIVCSLLFSLSFIWFAHFAQIIILGIGHNKKIHNDQLIYFILYTEQEMK